MSLELVVADRVAPQPWRNGGGQTRELAASPPGSHWDWRISLAEVRQDGAFSAYPGITRWFAVVQGDGVVLDFGHGRREMLNSASPPLQFDGALAPHCSLQGGATQDLNLMLRDSAASGTMLPAREGEEWISMASLRAVFAAEPMLLQIDDADAMVLPARSLVVSHHARRQRWRVVGGSGAPAAWWLAIEPRSVP